MKVKSVDDLLGRTVCILNLRWSESKSSLMWGFVGLRMDSFCVLVGIGFVFRWILGLIHVDK